ncbi:DUF962 domain-containing protein [Mycolicibacterium farcinogenes]|uniref:DUF962 domain-containing protein n=1 Tax=Mycolicibacterium farcinogenes TaxID=1802 RepID=A0ACD1FQR4_MYCFR|nr:DUF962 domain-containing protein [Mycolicibacterium farcinogenes]QZH69387.1 DUF962 domain-containing protein [Mycolicibacterium farcinogenes]
MDAPPPEAPFAEKLAFYRTQHTSRGVQATHLIGAPTIIFGMPLIFAKPKAGLSMFVAGWAVNILGHIAFEKNLPSTPKGWLTYQLTGLIHVSEMYGEMLARRSQRRAGRRRTVSGDLPLAHPPHPLAPAISTSVPSVIAESAPAT